MADDTYTGDWKTDAHAINGMQDDHYNLARYCESKGFIVIADPDDMEKSFIRVTETLEAAFMPTR